MATLQACVGLTGDTVALTDDEQSGLTALLAEQESLEWQYAEFDELPDEVDQRLGEIETSIAAFEDRPISYDPAAIARAGIFVSIGTDGGLRVDRGFVRPEDEAPVEPAEGGDDTAEGDRPCEPAEPASSVQRAVITVGGVPDPEAGTSDEDDAIRPLSDRLMAELTAHRTLALARCAGVQTGRGLPDGAACALPCSLLSLCLRQLPGDHGEKLRLRHPGARSGRVPLRQGDRSSARSMEQAIAQGAHGALGCADCVRRW